jgi:hypothetical protein
MEKPVQSSPRPVVMSSIPYSSDPAMLSLLEAREDSPVFRVKLGVAEQDIDDLAVSLKRIVKNFHSIVAHSAGMCRRNGFFFLHQLPEYSSPCAHIVLCDAM